MKAATGQCGIPGRQKMYRFRLRARQDWRVLTHHFTNSIDIACKNGWNITMVLAWREKPKKFRQAITAAKKNIHGFHKWLPDIVEISKIVTITHTNQTPYKLYRLKFWISWFTWNDLPSVGRSRSYSSLLLQSRSPVYPQHCSTIIGLSPFSSSLWPFSARTSCSKCRKYLLKSSTELEPTRCCLVWPTWLSSD